MVLPVVSEYVPERESGLARRLRWLRGLPWQCKATLSLTALWAFFGVVCGIAVLLDETVDDGDDNHDEHNGIVNSCGVALIIGSLGAWVMLAVATVVEDEAGQRATAPMFVLVTAVAWPLPAAMSSTRASLALAILMSCCLAAASWPAKQMHRKFGWRGLKRVGASCSVRYGIWLLELRARLLLDLFGSAFMVTCLGAFPATPVELALGAALLGLGSLSQIAIAWPLRPSPKLAARALLASTSTTRLPAAAAAAAAAAQQQQQPPLLAADGAATTPKLSGPGARRAPSLRALGGAAALTHALFFSYAAARAGQASPHAALCVAFVSLCTAPVLARCALVWSRCVDVSGAATVGAPPAPRTTRPVAVGGGGGGGGGASGFHASPGGGEDAQAAAALATLASGAAVVVCHESGRKTAAWLQLSHDLTTVRWGWDTACVELERLNAVWLGVGLEAATRRASSAGVVAAEAGVEAGSVEESSRLGLGLGEKTLSRLAKARATAGGLSSFDLSANSESTSLDSPKKAGGGGGGGAATAAAAARPGLVRTSTKNLNGGAAPGKRRHTHDASLLTLFYGTVSSGLEHITLRFADAQAAATWARGLRARKALMAPPPPPPSAPLSQALRRAFDLNDTEGDGYLPEAGVMSALRSLGLSLRTSAAARHVRPPTLAVLLRHLAPLGPPDSLDLVELSTFEQLVLWLRRGAMVINVADGLLTGSDGSSALETRHGSMERAAFEQFWTEEQQRRALPLEPPSPPPPPGAAPGAAEASAAAAPATVAPPQRKQPPTPRRSSTMAAPATRDFVSGAELCDLLLADGNELFDPIEDSVDAGAMRRPLCEYWINSSHNTYLEGDQLASASTAAIYRRVLRMGCRCVELDMWDGPDGEPLITHGNTRCGVVSLQEVAAAIAQEAFLASDYPLILSLENHLCAAQQARAAQIFVDELGDMIAMPPPPDEVDGMPSEPMGSPADLKNKIVLKGKAAPAPSANVAAEHTVRLSQRGSLAAASASVEESSSSDSDGDDAKPDGGTDAASKVAGDKVAKEMRPTSCMSKRSTAFTDMSSGSSLVSMSSMSSMSMASSVGGVGGVVGGAHEHGHDSAHAIDPHLASLIYLRTHKTLPEAKRWVPDCYMSSYEELKATKLEKKGADAWARHNAAYCSRVYPGNARVDSSNYAPTPFWACGVQMVALNFQTPQTLPMQLNVGLFRANGNSGYVLKPRLLRAPPPPPPPPPEKSSLTKEQRKALKKEKKRALRLGWDGASVLKVSMRLLCAEFLPQPNMPIYEPDAADEAKNFHPPTSAAAAAALAQTGYQLRPYVTLSLHGGEFAGAASSLKACVHGGEYRSDYAEGGFAPLWDASCEGAASHPECALLRLCVHHHARSGGDDDDGRGGGGGGHGGHDDGANDELLACEVVPLSAVRPGYRMLRLRDRHGSRLTLSKVLVHVELEWTQLPAQNVREAYYEGERQQELRQVGVGRDNGVDAGVFGFEERRMKVSERMGAARMTVRRVGGGDAAAVVYYTTADGTATAGLDYVPQSGRLLFRKGDIAHEVKVRIIDDDEVEGTEHFFVRLLRADGGGLEQTQIKVAIKDDDQKAVEDLKSHPLYGILEATLTGFALIGNELCQLNLDKDADDFIGVVTLVCFFFFTVDICFIHHIDPTYRFSARFLLDAIATLVLLPSTPWFFTLVAPVFGVEVTRQFTQGTAARASRAARVGGRAGRTMKHVTRIMTAGLSFLLAKTKTVKAAIKKRLKARKQAKKRKKAEKRRRKEAEEREAAARASEHEEGEEGAEGAEGAAGGAKAEPPGWSRLTKQNSAARMSLALAANSQKVARGNSNSLDEEGSVRSRASMRGSVRGLGGGIAARVQRKVAGAPVISEDEARRRAADAKEKADAKANKQSQGNPSRVGVHVLELFVSKITLMMLTMLMLNAVLGVQYEDALQSNFREQTLLVMNATYTGPTPLGPADFPTSELYGGGARSAETNATKSSDMSLVFARYGGRVLYEGDLSLMRRRRYVELLYLYEGTSECDVPLDELEQLTNESYAADCPTVVVYDQYGLVKNSLRSQIYLTFALVIILVGGMAFLGYDMQKHLIAPIERLTKVIKVLSGKAWRKRAKARLAPTEDGGGGGDGTPRVQSGAAGGAGVGNSERNEELTGPWPAHAERDREKRPALEWPTTHPIEHASLSHADAACDVVRRGLSLAQVCSAPRRRSRTCSSTCTRCCGWVGSSSTTCRSCTASRCRSTGASCTTSSAASTARSSSRTTRCASSPRTRRPSTRWPTRSGGWSSPSCPTRCWPR